MSNDETHLPANRRQQIAELIESQGQVFATELSQQFNVSEDTIRRDLRDLAKKGKAKRVHGGAVRSSADSGWEHQERQHRAGEQKHMLAEVAVSLIRPGQVIILDAGTTNLQIAQKLPNNSGLTVITNSPHIAIAASEREAVSVIMTGGKLLNGMQALTGVSAVETFRRINADLCFLGACAIHPQYGICASNDDEVHVKQAMLASAAESVVVATEDKLGALEPYKIAPIDSLSHLITDASESKTNPFVTAGLSVLTP